MERHSIETTGLQSSRALEPARRRAATACAPRALFVVHAEADAWFVRGELLPFLGLPEEQVRLTSELPLGELTLDALERFVEASQVTVVIISAAYAADPLAQYTEQLASHDDLEGGGRVVPLVLDQGVASLRLRARVSLQLGEPAGWEAELTRLAELLEQPVAPREELACPYPGLRPLAREDTAKLLGRDRELDDLVARVRAGERELYLVGPSGSGKSSLVAAGVLPRLAAGGGQAGGAVTRWLRPGEAPLTRLREALLPEAKVAARASTALPELGPEPLEQAVAEELRRHVDQLLGEAPAGGRLVLHVDQLEEIFTLAGEAEREPFFAALQVLRADPRCLILYCLRADFFANLIISPLWSESACCVTVAPLRGAGLREAIERPARDSGVFLEPGLVERLLADARGASGILPLVQETLLQLWEQRRRRVLTLSCYERMGRDGRSGLAVALSRRADACLAALSPARQKIARRILLRLVHFGEGAADTRCQRPRDELTIADEPRAELEAVLDHLARGRLITTDGGVERSRRRVARVDLTHESLIAAWDKLAGWIEQRRADGQRRRQLEAAAAAWVGLARGEGGLLHDRELAPALEWSRGEAAQELGQSAELQALLEASTQARRRRRRRSRASFAGVAALAAALAMVAALLSWRGRELDEQRAERVTAERRSTEQLARYEEERARRELLSGRPLRALPHLVAAREARAAEEPGGALRFMFHQTQKTQLEEVVRLPSKVTAVAISPDGAVAAIAGADGAVELRSATARGRERASFVHPGGVLALAVSPDGQRVVTGGDDGFARLWSRRGAALATLGHGGPVRGVAFNADGSQVLTASDDRTARVWDAVSGAQVSALPHDGAVLSAAFVAQDVVVTGSADHHARVWQVDGAVLAKVPHADAVSAAGLSSDGARLLTVTGQEGARLRHLDVAARAPGAAAQAGARKGGQGAAGQAGARKGGQGAAGQAGARKPLPKIDPPRGASFASFSPDGEAVVTIGADPAARLVHGRTGKREARLPHGGAVRAAAFSGDGRLILTGSADKTARLWAVPSGMALSAPLEHDGEVALVAIDREGRRLLTASGEEARLWTTELDVRERQPLRHETSVMSVAFLPERDQVVTADSGRGASVWSLRTGARLAAFGHGEDRLRLAVSGDGKWLVTAAGGSLKLWGLRDRAARELPPVHRGDVLDLAFSLDGRYLATASNDVNAAIWDVERGVVDAPLLAHDEAVTSVAFHPGGDVVATGTEAGMVHLWRRRTGERLASVAAHALDVNSLHFSPDGKLLVSGGDDELAQVWAVDGNSLRLSRALEHDQRVDCVRMSPDGALIATASRDRRVRIWDGVTGEELARRGYRELVRSLAWSPDGAWLLTGESSGDVWVWDVARDAGSLQQWRRSGARAAQGPRGAQGRLPNRHAESVSTAATAYRSGTAGR